MELNFNEITKQDAENMAILFDTHVVADDELERTTYARYWITENLLTDESRFNTVVAHLDYQFPEWRRLLDFDYDEIVGEEDEES